MVYGVVKKRALEVSKSCLNLTWANPELRGVVPMLVLGCRHVCHFTFRKGCISVGKVKFIILILLTHIYNQRLIIIIGTKKSNQ